MFNKDVENGYTLNNMEPLKWLQSFSTQKDTLKSLHLLVQSHTFHSDTKLKDFKIREAIYIYVKYFCFTKNLFSNMYV
jgi:hypothetical protein